jgi:hypothetical protein
MKIITEFIKKKQKKTNNMRRFIFIFPALIMILDTMFSITAPAQGNLIMLTKRVVFEGHKTTQILEFGNIGKDTATYTISLLHMKMKEDGSLEKEQESDTTGLFADDYIRYYPHTIVLAPKESQTMKVQLINSENMKPGEYRSHMYFRATRTLKDEKADTTGLKHEGFSVSLSPLFGISIPVIIRVGKPAGTINLTDVGIEVKNDTSRVLNFKLRRTGNFSVYGDISVVYVPEKGKETEIQRVRGIAVYNPISLRTTKLALLNKKGIDFHNGKLVVRYTKPMEEKGTLLAQAEFPLR